MQPIRHIQKAFKPVKGMWSKEICVSTRFTPYTVIFSLISVKKGPIILHFLPCTCEAPWPAGWHTFCTVKTDAIVFPDILYCEDWRRRLYWHSVLWRLTSLLTCVTEHLFNFLSRGSRNVTKRSERTATPPLWILSSETRLHCCYADKIIAWCGWEWYEKHKYWDSFM